MGGLLGGWSVEWTLPERLGPQSRARSARNEPMVRSTLTKVSADPKDRWRELGSFIREQRGTNRLSLRRLSELAGISNPYLSQIERGLRRPSAEILQQIAKALRISAETLYVQAGILEPGTGEADVSREILADPLLTEDQKQALIRIYLSFRHENETSESGPEAGPASDVETGD